MLPAGTAHFSSRAPIDYIAIATDDVTTNQGLKSVVPYSSGYKRRSWGPRTLRHIQLLLPSHYGLDHGLANPRSGNEKGNCENMVGAHSRAMFVPVPSFHDAGKSDERPPEDSLDLSDKCHYRLGVPQIELFGEDRAALLPLPAMPFSCVKWEKKTRRANKQGEVVLGGIHRHDVEPRWPGARRRSASAPSRSRSSTP